MLGQVPTGRCEGGRFPLRSSGCDLPGQDFLPLPLPPPDPWPGHHPVWAGREVSAGEWECQGARAGSAPRLVVAVGTAVQCVCLPGPSTSTPNSPPTHTPTPMQRYPTLTRDARCDVCIVGGGLSGLLTAYRLAQAGRWCGVRARACMHAHTHTKKPTSPHAHPNPNSRPSARHTYICAPPTHNHNHTRTHIPQHPRQASTWCWWRRLRSARAAAARAWAC